ncbi:hypothetical protein HMPREF9629_00794 [Peptoanaerobacter stomatis]|uniref:Phosphoribulokinase/uridine kinase domain-containing protein n=1 Tax=Peptoanaerobacter stomatis TaxID=796937 RepID=G9X337_9FIRM|nr:nucleoside kinase [Peptoanaerobacter stomatis]EHL10579.1 hypothetical protein HMPREF9629_00794 [Peptoanaerobacter stomatis]
MNIKYKGKNYSLEQGSTIEEFIKKYDIQKEYKYIITIAVVDNNLKELTTDLYEDANIELLDISSKDARNVYMRSLSFVFLVALKRISDTAICRIEHSLSNGFFCDIEEKSNPINRHYVSNIYEEMKKITDAGLPITRSELDVEDAKEFYKNDIHKLGLLDYRKDEKVNIYDLDGYKNYFYGYMVPSTDYLKIYNIRLCNGGVVLLGPDVNNPDKLTEFKHEPRLFSIYSEAKDWAKTINIPTAFELNNAVKNGSYHDIIRYAEAYHEKKICEISDVICRDNKKIILIAGPSSSGKTSFSQRLKIQLIASKKRPISISMDNYFIDRDKNIPDKNGKRDFESLKALDVEKFNEDLDMLISGYEVKLPVYDFITGKRKDDTDTIPTKIGEDQPIIIEGIHGLNPALTEAISSAYKYKIYVSELTQLSLDEYNSISTTDVRLIRRIIRDNSHRGYSAEATMDMWDSVNEGERKNIFVFQENADIMFNSALIYELSAMKKYIEPLLEEISPDSPYYKEAKRILKFTQYFLSIDDESDIPNTSILREFIGGSKLVD